MKDAPSQELFKKVKVKKLLAFIPISAKRSMKWWEMAFSLRNLLRKEKNKNFKITKMVPNTRLNYQKRKLYRILT